MQLNNFNARERLGKREISFDMLAGIVGQVDRGFAVLTGSWVDGFPNLDSDIDILVVSASKLAGPVFNFSDGDSFVYSASIKGVEVNIEVYTPDAVERVQKYMESNVKVFAGQAPATELTFFDAYSDLRFIHRIATGVPIIGEDRWRETSAAFGADFLRFYICGLRTKEHFALREDAISDFSEGAGLSALVQARNASVQLVHGAMALYGCTHAGDRWLAHYLARSVLPLDDEHRQRLIRLLNFQYSLADQPGMQLWLDDCNAVVGQIILPHHPDLARLFVAISGSFPVRMAM